MYGKSSTCGRTFGLVAVLLTLSLSACGGDDEEAPPAGGSSGDSGEKIVIRVSSESPIEVDPLPTAVRFKEQVEEATDGRVEVEIFASAQLFDDTAALDAVASDQLEIVLPTTSRLTGFARDFAVLDLPFVFTSADDFQTKVLGDLGDALNEKLAEKGMQVLSYWSGGAVTFHNTDAELKTPDEWKGKKIRVFGGEVYEDTIKAAGANPVAIPASEVPTSVQQGVVDAAVTNWDGWEEVFIDLFDYGMDPGAWQLAFGVVVNKKFWDGLPDDIRATLEREMADVTEFDWTNHAKIETEAIENIRAAGKTPYELSDADRQAWSDATQSVRDKYSQELDSAIYELATAAP